MPATSRSTTLADAGPAAAERRAGATRRLKVLLVLEAAGGGTGRHVLDLASGLLKRNHGVCLAWSPARAEAWFARSLDALPALSVHELPMARGVGPGDLRAARALRRMISELGPFDVVHGHSSKAGAVARVAAVGTGVPCIYTPHAMVTLDSGLSFAARRFYASVERLLAPLAARVICVSTEERDHAEALGIAPSRLATVHNGLASAPVDALARAARREAARRDLGLAPADVCVGFVGRLAPQKNVALLIEGFAIAAQRYPGLRLMIVGDGPDAPALREQAQATGLGARIRFAGAIPAVPLLPALDLFALPSRFEGLPYVLLEAAAAGLPIVMTRTGGASAVVEEGASGYVVEQGDVEALAQRLAILAGDARRRMRMGQAAAGVAARFPVDRMVEETLEVYAAAVAGSAQ